MARINIWLPEELKEYAKKLNINLSREFRSWLVQKIKEHGIEVNLKDPELILLVGCPHCGHEFQTASIGQVRCPRCEKTFRVYIRRGHSRIRKIIKGDIQTLYRLYARKFQRSLI